MRTIWHLFTGDVRRLFSNIVSVIIVIGLTVIPGLFSWFNITASWDPFANLKNLKFAVASVDKGYQSDLIPVKITIGDTVVNTLRANSQLDWTITTKTDAIDGTKSGKYYAAIVIPKDFSQKMMTFFSADASNVDIAYYENEKKNALAPNLTTEGASEVSTQINEMFAETLTGTALSIASQLADDLSDPKASAALGRFSANIGDFATSLTDGASTLNDYASLTDAAGTLLTNSTQLLGQASSAATDAGKQLKSAKTSATGLTGAMGDAAEALSQALSTSADSYGAVADSIDGLYSTAGTQAEDTAKALDTQSSHVQAQIDEYRKIRDDIASLQQQLPGNLQSLLDPMLTQLDAAIDLQANVKSRLDDAAAAVRAKNSSAQDQHTQVKELAKQAKASIAGVKADFDANVKPQLTKLNASVNDATRVLDSGAAKLKTTLKDLDGTAKDANASLKDVHDTLTGVADKLTKAGTELGTFNDKLAKALDSGDMSMVKEVLGNNPETLAATLAAPVALKRKAVFPVDNFGSSLAPLYLVIPLWVGALLMAVTLKTTVSRRVRRELGDPKPHQMYLGHYGVFALIALAQSTFSFGGALLFIHVQAVHPLLFMLTGWASSLLFSFFAYTMVVSFGNVGKAIGVLMLIVQISGSNAAYPLQVLPGWIGAISPFLPVTHSVTMIRAAIAGVYDMDYWRALGQLFLFVPPLLLVGLVLRKPLVRFNQWYVAKVESTKVVA
ncbi:YhgE/Pip domain-containing protein [Bifidobacterium saguinibicoloris]|uniref:YhgE/Pip domain-containing protein n=1 Tax=Bifidobacterium saguinibicoloris TaxID=2834433 RepID=UPI001C59CB6B|nr:YhgE/Pip domain-containing protein [Bifidobacterium saguinibicoloris]MBW3080936.1 YhgE/Pip domain-containing protein [Bifidobacterium saguinibicoloris]